MIIGPFKATLSDYDGEEQILDFCGEQFKIALDVGGMPLLEFADAAANGVDASEMAGLAAMYSMIRDCLADGEWDRFRQTAKKNKASIALIMQVCTSIYEALAKRPLVSASSSTNGVARGEIGEDSKPTFTASQASGTPATNGTGQNA